MNQPHIFDESFKAIEELWTIYLPKVLDDNEILQMVALLTSSVSILLYQSFWRVCCQIFPCQR